MERIQSPRTDDDAIEQEIIAKGLTAPRVAPADIEENIRNAYYFTALQGAMYPDGQGEREPIEAEALGLLTFCVLVLRNGFTVVGKSACASPENFDTDLGRKIARADAVNQVWPLMGYNLKQRLFMAPSS